MLFVSAEALGVVRWRVGGAAAGRGRLRPITGRGPERGPAHLDAQLGPSVQPPPGLLRTAALPAATAQGPSQQGHSRPAHARHPAAEHRRGRAALPDYRGDDLRPNTVELRADSLINFAELLASHNRCGSQSRRPKAPRHHHLSGQQPLTAQADQSPNRVPRFTKWAPPLGPPSGPLRRQSHFRVLSVVVLPNDAFGLILLDRGGPAPRTAETLPHPRFHSPRT